MWYVEKINFWSIYCQELFSMMNQFYSKARTFVYKNGHVYGKSIRTNKGPIHELYQFDLLFI